MNQKQLTIQRLKNFKKNYNFTSKEIAKELQVNEAVVSHWFSGNTEPRPDNIYNIYNFFNKYCIPGIIRIPKNKYWNSSYFLRVGDIKDPYISWYDDEFSGKAPEVFSQWVKSWAEQFPSPAIYRVYEPSIQGRVRCHLDALNLNTTIQFKDYFIGCKDVYEGFLKCPHTNPTDFDWSLLEQLVSGEDDGTT